VVRSSTLRSNTRHIPCRRRGGNDDSAGDLEVVLLCDFSQIKAAAPVSSGLDYSGLLNPHPPKHDEKFITNRNVPVLLGRHCSQTHRPCYHGYCNKIFVCGPLALDALVYHAKKSTPGPVHIGRLLLVNMYILKITHSMG